MHRVKSAIWVAAYIRRVAGEGLNAVVARRGAEEAGAIFVKINRLNGTADLYGPAPQSAFGDEPVLDRLFERLLDGAADAEADRRIRREADFDPDLWAIELDDRQARPFLEVVRERPQLPF